MKQKGQKRSGAGLFLIELTIALLIFAFAAAICTSIFAAAYHMSEESEALAGATSIARNAAEIIRSGNGKPADRYDKQGRPADSATAYILQTEEVHTDDGLTEVTLTVLTGSGDVLYTLSVVKGDAV